MPDRETFFITGFPGFIANRLLERMARKNCDFILLVQPSLVTHACEEIDRIASLTGRSVAEFQIVEGDIAEPNLALSALDLDLVQQETTRVFHLAAVYDLAVPEDVALRVNVGGTRNVIALARSLPHLKQFHHVSTCYVAGKREGAILETELRHDAGYRNYYEESKYLAELEVDSAKADLPVTIHRPSVVCGDSQTGETGKYDGVYYLIHYLLRWPSMLSMINIGNHKVSLNLVPVDFVVDSMAALAFDERAIGKTLQLADPAPLTTNQLFNTIAKSIDGHRSKITAPARWVRFFLMLPPSPRITGLPHHAVPYFFVRQLYDTSQAQELLAAHDIRCPRFVSYVDRIVEFAKQHPIISRR
ncbi:MAG TPA: SDR family oxidoreductase [Pyrinomonadaceae bacterium]|jgi:thioester reductase-like protein|nr:SDR family oxidoreductase [Pyrinomonadaceae bacterium]